MVKTLRCLTLAVSVFVLPDAFAESSRTLAPIEVDGGRLSVTLEPDVFDLPHSELRDWITQSAEALITYYGYFPVPETDIRLRASSGDSVRTGRMTGAGVPVLYITVGARSDRAALDRDWVLVHEMVHTAFPNVPYHQNWIEEGLAVYVEAISRLQAGHISAELAWGSFMRGMPNGRPGLFDQGLDRTNSWGNRYWGGAIFCLLADLEIRRQTDNKLGLQDALRGVLKAGLDNRREGDLAETFKLADGITGTTVLTKLYEERRHTAVDTDLDLLWQQLGVIKSGRSVRFDDDAPEAYLRRAISTRRDT